MTTFNLILVLWWLLIHGVEVVWTHTTISSFSSINDVRNHAEIQISTNPFYHTVRTELQSISSTASPVICPLGHCRECSQCGTECCNCMSGAYCPGDDKQYLCNAGTANAFFNSSSVTSCLSCGSGNYSMPGATICSVCPVGTFAGASIGATSCTLCPTNTFNPNVGQSSITACQQCGAGKVSSLGSWKCSYSSSVVAGYTSLASSGGDGGPATLALFNNPSAIAFDPVYYNLMYVADTNNHVIRMVDLNAGIITRFAGVYGGSTASTLDGYLATQAYLYYPQDVKIDLSGNVYIADTKHCQIRVVDTITNIISTYAGYYVNSTSSAFSRGYCGYNADGGAATSSCLNYPTGIALDAAANLYIADSTNARIRYVSKSLGTMTTLIYGPSYFGSTWYPSSIAIDSTGKYVYVTVPNYVRIYKVTASGGMLSTYSVVAGGGSSAWTVATSFAAMKRNGTSIYLPNPNGPALDQFGNLYFSDITHGMVGVINNVTGMVSLVMGTGYPGYHGDDGPATQVSLNNPAKISFDPLGNFYVADQSNGRIRKAAIGQSAPSCPPGQVWYSTQCNGCCICPAGYYCPGDNYQHICPANTYSTALGATLTSTCLPCPTGTFSSPGSVISSACSNNQLMVVAGNPYSFGNTGNSGAATSATMYYPHDVAVDSSNNLYILDLQYNVVRKVNSTTGIITTVAGNGGTCSYGYSPTTSGSPRTTYFLMNARYQSSTSCGDVGAATSATFNDPYGIAVDISGNLFIADRGNLVVRKMTASTRIMSTVTGHGYASSSQVVTGVTYACGTCYQTCYLQCCNTCDYSCSCSWGFCCCCKTACNSVECGTSNCKPYDCNPYTCNSVMCPYYYTVYSAGFGGDNGAATSAYLNSPSGVAVDISGNLYIADTGNNRIRMVAATTQVITTLVYTGTTGATYLSSPWRIAVDQKRNVFIADTNRHVIRKYTAATNVVTVYAGIDGIRGSTGDNKRASKAKLYSPIGIAIDYLGNVYIADTNNYRIRRVDWGPGNNLNITTVAGNGLCCWAGDSPTPVNSYLTSDMNGLAVTPYGTLYLPSENKYSVRAVQVPISGNLGTTCGDCYLPSSAGSFCCQTCSQVVAAQIALQLTYNSLCFVQCNPNGCPAACSASACSTTPSPTGQW